MVRRGDKQRRWPVIPTTPKGMTFVPGTSRSRVDGAVRSVFDPLPPGLAMEAEQLDQPEPVDGHEALDHAARLSSFVATRLAAAFAFGTALFVPIAASDGIELERRGDFYYDRTDGSMAMTRHVEPPADIERRLMSHSEKLELMGLQLPERRVALEPRWVPTKPEEVLLYELQHRDRVVVKFVEGIRVRLRDGILEAGGAPIAEFEAVRAAFPEATVQRMFSQPEYVLDENKETGERIGGRELADLNNYYLLMFPGDTGRSIELGNALLELPSVEYAYLPSKAMLPGGSCEDAAPPTPDWEANQFYLDAAPAGVDARYAWSYHAGGDGTPSFQVVDLEWAWCFDHEDLIISEADVINGSTPNGSPAFDDPSHGTAVLGEYGACDNGYGVTGIAHEVALKMADFDSEPSWASNIMTAAGALFPGEVMLLEIHISGPSQGTNCQCNCGQFQFVPVEWDNASWDAIATATAGGIIVVEAGGNGSMDLDHSVYGGWFAQSHDSGALIVGAAHPGSHSPECWTNYGETVDLHAYGSSIYTTGYGGLFNAGGCSQDYTATFGGTSGASPIVVGAAASLQSISNEKYGLDITPALMRAALRSGGTPQGAPVSRNIGPMPDLFDAIEVMESWVQPEVVSVTPADQATEVPVTTAITVVFSMEMNLPSAESAFTLSDAVRSFTGSFSWAGNAMTFTPSAPLPSNDGYTVHVSTAATSAAGVPLEAPFSSSFATESGIANGGFEEGAVDWSFVESIVEGEMASASWGVGGGSPLEGAKSLFAQSNAGFAPRNGATGALARAAQNAYIGKAEVTATSVPLPFDLDVAQVLELQYRISVGIDQTGSSNAQGVAQVVAGVDYLDASLEVIGSAAAHQDFVSRSGSQGAGTTSTTQSVQASMCGAPAGTEYARVVVRLITESTAFPAPPANAVECSATVDGFDVEELPGPPCVEPVFQDVTDDVLDGDDLASRGVAWFDYLYSGTPDLYICNKGGANALLRNMNDGTFTDDAASAGVDDPSLSTGATAVDYDNDRYVDIFVTSDGVNRLYHAYGSPPRWFEEVWALPYDRFSTGAAWADYDQDGWVDVYVTNNPSGRPRGTRSGMNGLFHNEEGETFSDLCAYAGVCDDNLSYSSSPVWADFDDDRDQDLYVASWGENRLYRNEGDGTFTDVAGQPGFTPLLAPEASMSAEWGDYDNDGDLDLYVGQGIEGNAPNKLFRNELTIDCDAECDTTISFVEVAAGTPLADAGETRGVSWVDYDNDADLDLLVVINYYDANLPGGTIRLFRNEGNDANGDHLGFADVSHYPLAGLDEAMSGVWADYDRDGDQDLYVTSTGDPSTPEGENRLFENVLDNGNHWYHVRLVGRDSNELAIGARVRILAGGVEQIREISAGSGLGSQSYLHAAFGLGSATVVDLVEITWPDGERHVAATNVTEVDRVRYYHEPGSGGGNGCLDVALYDVEGADREYLNTVLPGNLSTETEPPASTADALVLPLPRNGEAPAYEIRSESLEYMALDAVELLLVDADGTAGIVRTTAGGLVALGSPPVAAREARLVTGGEATELDPLGTHAGERDDQAIYEWDTTVTVGSAVVVEPKILIIPQDPCGEMAALAGAAITVDAWMDGSWTALGELDARAVADRLALELPHGSLPAPVQLRFTWRTAAELHVVGIVPDSDAVTASVRLQPSAAQHDVLGDVRALVGGADGDWVLIAPSTGVTLGFPALGEEAEGRTPVLALTGWFGYSPEDLAGPVAVPPGGIASRPSIRLVGSTIVGRSARWNVQLASAGEAALRIFDVSGRLVRALELGATTPGLSELRWDGRDARGSRVPPGAYFWRFTGPDLAVSDRLFVVR